MDFNAQITENKTASPIVLTPHQAEKGDLIIDKIRKGVRRIVLSGSAGTGKTTLAKEIVRRLLRDHTINPRYNNGTVYVCAPTNKALAILQSKIQLAVEFKTVHSALKLQRWIDNRTGIQMFKKKKQYGRPKPEDFDKCKAAIIDEASMLPSKIEGSPPNVPDEDKIKGYLSEYQFPIIYLGDNKQLNPIGEYSSPVFMKDYETVELTEIIRQGQGNPIIDLSRDLDMIYFKTPETVGGKGYVFSNNRAGIIENLAEVNGTDEFKYLAYNVDEIAAMNLSVRQRIYGENPKRIEKGETIVFNSPFGNFYTNKEVKVESVEIVTQYMPVPNSNTKYDENYQPINDTDKIRMKFYRVNDSFNVVHEHSDYIYHTISNYLKQMGNVHGWSFIGHYYFKEMFADIVYNHGITVHKSQGSTYKEVVINVGNIDTNRNAAEHRRMLYTAVTRASDLVILNNVP